VRRGRATKGGIAAAAVIAGLLASAAPSGASEYSKSLARKAESEVVYVDPKAKPKVSVAEAGRVRIQIVKKAPGRIKIVVVPESRVEDEGGVTGLGSAIARDLKPRGSLLVVAGDNRFIITSHPASDQAAKAVDEAFNRNQGDRGKQLLASVNGIAAVDPGPSADPQGAPDIGDFNNQADDIFDSVEDTFRVTTIIVALSFLIPILAVAVWIVYRVRRSRQEAEGDKDFEQEGLRNQLIALGDDIRGVEVDASMPGVNALAVADYEAAVQQYDRANSALERSEQNPRYMAEAKAAIVEGQRRMSDAKVRLGVTPTP
jgi:hypothetical protein